MRDGEKLAAWLIEGAHEIRNAHAILDLYDVPRHLDPESQVEMTLAARITYALASPAPEPAHG